jgi:hypothetical protein
MKLNKQHLGALTALIALTLSACGGGNTAPVPQGTPPAPPPGPLALLATTQNVQIPSTNGATGVVSIPGGTGTVNVAITSTAPSGSVALQSLVRTASVKTEATSSDSPLVYVAITSSATSTLKGVPGMTLNLPSTAPAGSVFEALWNGAQWITVGTAGTVSGSTVTLAGSTTAQTVTPGAPLFLVAYVGVTQSGVQSNVIVDGGFEIEGAAHAFAGATNGWAACSYAHPNAASTAAAPTPVPAVTGTPITSVLVSSTSANFTVGATPKPTATPPVPTPAPTITPAIHGGSFAALTYTGTGADTSYGKSKTAGANGICQTFVVPVSGVLTLFANEGGDEEATDGDQEGTLFVGGLSALAAASPSPISVFSDLNATVPVVTPTATYVQKGPFALTLAPPMGLGIAAGTTVTLFLGTFDNDSSNTFGEYMFVDDVSLMGFLPQTASGTSSSTR